jgi:hypothetical protein
VPTHPKTPGPLWSPDDHEIHIVLRGDPHDLLAGFPHADFESDESRRDGFAQLAQLRLRVCASGFDQSFSVSRVMRERKRGRRHVDDVHRPGHISEIADGNPPHTPRGCPFQAWSVGEALRLDLSVLAE